MREIPRNVETEREEMLLLLFIWRFSYKWLVPFLFIYFAKVVFVVVTRTRNKRYRLMSNYLFIIMIPVVNSKSSWRRWDEKWSYKNFKLHFFITRVKLSITVSCNIYSITYDWSTISNVFEDDEQFTNNYSMMYLSP